MHAVFFESLNEILWYTDRPTFKENLVAGFLTWTSVMFFSILQNGNLDFQFILLLCNSDYQLSVNRN